MNLTKEEIKLLFRSLRYWQMYQASYEGKEYKMCQDLMNRFTEHLKS